jgi:hypothetical protein
MKTAEEQIQQVFSAIEAAGDGTLKTPYGDLSYYITNRRVIVAGPLRVESPGGPVELQVDLTYQLQGGSDATEAAVVRVHERCKVCLDGTPVLNGRDWVSNSRVSRRVVDPALKAVRDAVAALRSRSDVRVMHCLNYMREVWDNTNKKIQFSELLIQRLSRRRAELAETFMRMAKAEDPVELWKPCIQKIHAEQETPPYL